MSTSDLTRLFYLACELRPALPDKNLLSRLGKSWAPIIRAGAELGLGGATSALPGVNMDQMTNFYMAGAESGAAPHLDEFRSLLAGRLYENITSSTDLSIIEQIELNGRLSRWYNGLNSVNGDGSMDWDASINVPPFTRTGFWPLDRIAGKNGLAQGVVTMVARPEVGKTTMAIATAFNWRRLNIGPVVFIQTELAASVMRMKIDGMAAGLGIEVNDYFRKDVDRLVFGRRAADDAMSELIANPDPDRLVIFDSVGGYCGQGDTAESRVRFADLYDSMVQVKNHSRLVIACAHVKRGVDMADIESAAGSSAVERFSDYLFYITKDPTPRPDGMLDAQFESLKNRYGDHQRRVKFLMNYVTGQAVEEDFGIESAMEELE